MGYRRWNSCGTQKIVLADFVFEMPAALQGWVDRHPESILHGIQKSSAIQPRKRQWVIAPHECVAGSDALNDIFRINIDGHRFDTTVARKLCPAFGIRLAFTVSLDDLVWLDRDLETHDAVLCKAGWRTCCGCEQWLDCRISAKKTSKVTSAARTVPSTHVRLPDSGSPSSTQCRGMPERPSSHN